MLFSCVYTIKIMRMLGWSRGIPFSNLFFYSILFFSLYFTKKRFFLYKKMEENFGRSFFFRNFAA